MAKIHELGFELLDHPPYSPDPAPSDFLQMRKSSIKTIETIILQKRRQVVFGQVKGMRTSVGEEDYVEK